METKNFLFLLVCLSLAISACSTARRQENNQPIIYSQKGPETVATSPQLSAPPATSATPGEVLPVGIYFGPAAMRSYAYVGVLKAFAQAQIPVVSVGGAEWGAVVAGLYSFSKSANDVEWQMLKLRKDQIPTPSFIKKEMEPREPEALEGFLRFVFGEKNLETGKIPFECPTTDGARMELVRQGRAWEQMLKCTVIPPFYRSDRGWVSGAISQVDWSGAMIRDGAKFIIYVDALVDEPLFNKSRFSQQENVRLFWAAVKNLSKEQYRQANLVLSIPLNQDLMDFDNRREAIKFGEKFTAAMVPDLMKLIGVK